MYTLALIFIILFAVYVVSMIVFLTFSTVIQEWVGSWLRNAQYIRPVLEKHFRSIEADDLYIVSRSFQKMQQIELYREIQKILVGKTVVRSAGIVLYGHSSRLNEWLSTDHYREFAPLKYVEADIGEEKQSRSLDNAFYLVLTYLYIFVILHFLEEVLC